MEDKAAIEYPNHAEGHRGARKQVDRRANASILPLVSGMRAQNSLLLPCFSGPPIGRSQVVGIFPCSESYVLRQDRETILGTSGRVT